MSEKRSFVVAVVVFSTLIVGCTSTQGTNIAGRDQTTKISEPPTGWAVEPSNFYNVCLPIHTQLASGRKEANPEIVAHYICKVIEGICKSNPAGDDCQKGQREIRESLNK